MDFQELVDQVREACAVLSVERAENDDNVRNVREDTCISPYSVTVDIGEKIEDTYIPMV